LPVFVGPPNSAITPALIQELGEWLSLTHLRRDPGQRWHVAGIQTVMIHQGIYAPAGGVFLAVVEQTLQDQEHALSGKS
jgi:hypothetical protein